ncbi:kinase domain protein (macronuclear) [Tetrahymena thermophila SB210]|uniref:Kinase domain protein n=1 Tax=Tetrahymena thermophila (strain SB210) TaxID=312017 RepID=Q23QG5_TETTS|nr:kinase domain protein [Tetrahymena thermophila SB210]EAR98923.2 kinase domain protein [Tetrahymena thermophila SB210]|eukprot:XP_001019168.2 kinase domain protein [Tetrahymena thermophila SB210]
MQREKNQILSYQNKMDQYYQQIIKSQSSDMPQNIIQQIETTIGTLKIIKKLDQGAIGKVFQAVNLKNNEEVAIKLESTKKEKKQLQI